MLQAQLVQAQLHQQRQHGQDESGTRNTLYAPKITANCPSFFHEAISSLKMREGKKEGVCFLCAQSTMMVISGQIHFKNFSVLLIYNYIATNEITFSFTVTTNTSGKIHKPTKKLRKKETDHPSHYLLTLLIFSLNILQTNRNCILMSCH